MNLINIIRCDLYRYSGEKTIKAFLKNYFRNSGFKFTVWLRICYFSRKKLITRFTIFPLAKLIYNHYMYKFGYKIPYTIDIGPGLLLFHFSGIVISAQRIGKNATLSHCTTIGMKIVNGVKVTPVIGDNLYMAPGSKIIGDVIIGNNVAIGTNSVVNKSIDNNSVVVGIPGKIISYKGSIDYVNNPI
ncbi:serine O-acetyltransferase [Clostridium perfringens]|uniref:serine O-acetyltransferase n=1 Tax=Clostridium perfringens TaxID=1502 RepID=UPI001C842179|nr:hypothetical protein [Clostridium perfringens]ELC8389844.1 hypothetical protein [Clostridium perfringens]